MDPKKKITQDTDEEINSDGSADAFSETENLIPESDKDISDEELDEMMEED